MSYAYNAYMTAYCKAHFPHEFFTAYLKNAVGKPDTFWEVNELVNNAKIMDITVMPPNIINMNEEFKLIGKCPTYGLTNIKNVGSSVFKKMKNHIEENQINILECDWDCMLLLVAPHVNKKAFESLILAGAFDLFKISRSKMQHQFNTIKELTKREMEWVIELKKRNGELSAAQCISMLIEESEINTGRSRPIFRTDRIPAVKDLLGTFENPGYELYDAPSWVAKVEKELLGISLTCTKVDEYDTGKSNCTCKEYIDGFNSTHGIVLAVQIDSVREWKIKKGRAKGMKMGFLTVSDTTCSLDSVTAFSEEWEKYKGLLKEGNTLLLRGSRDKNRGSF